MFPDARSGLETKSYNCRSRGGKPKIQREEKILPPSAIAPTEKNNLDINVIEARVAYPRALCEGGLKAAPPQPSAAVSWN
jgi:hypothetical protein